MSLKVRGTRQLFTAPKGEKGDKGEDGNSFTPKGQAYGHFDSPEDFETAVEHNLVTAGYKYLVDDREGDYAMVYTKYGHGIGTLTADDGDAYTIVGTKHLWAATGNIWVDFGEIQGPPGENGQNGEDGNDAELYRLQMTEAWARWEKGDPTGWILKCSIKGNAWFIRGGTQMAATSGSRYEEQRIRIRYNNNKQLHYEPIAGDGSWTDGVAGKYLEDDEYGSSSVGQPECIIVELIGKDISDHTQVLDALTIAIAWDGEPGGKGNDGAPGPMGIPAGSYNSSAIYERTSEIVPIVEHNGKYWYPRNIGVLTNSEPSSNNDWRLVDYFTVMFVKILFAAFAKVGEAIFHGNFMFSQNGKVNGADSNNYQLFSPSDPDNEGNASRFAPNLYLNFLTGAARLAAGKAKFNADGSGSLAGDRIEWDNLGMKLAGVLYKKKTVITLSNLSQYMTVVGTFVENGETKNLYALDVLKAGTWIELNGIRPGVYFKLPSMKWNGTYTEAEKNLARSLVGCSVIISTVDSNICGFRYTHMRFYENYTDINGNRNYLDEDSPNANQMVFDYRSTVYLDCVMADVKDSNGWYREDIRWDARLVRENS